MIVLPDHHHSEAKRKAARNGISLSEYIRRLVALDLEPRQEASDPSAIFGMFDGGESNIADDKQSMVGNAVSERFASKGL